MMCSRAGEPAVRKGPCKLEEDLILAGYMSQHGEGSWDNLGRSAGKALDRSWLTDTTPTKFATVCTALLRVISV
jgi:hypothetical protein